MDVVSWTMHTSQIHIYPELQNVILGNWVFANLLIKMKSYWIKVESKPSGFITEGNTQRNTEKRGHVKSNPVCECGTPDTEVLWIQRSCRYRRIFTRIYKFGVKSSKKLSIKDRFIFC